ncbi:MAG: sensor histidine kinase [Planctomycetota bacterium]
MRSLKKSWGIATGLVAGSLLVGGLVGWLNSGIGVGSDGSAGNWDIFLLMCHFVGAVGVLLLGWHWLRLVRSIASMAGPLQQDQATGSGKFSIFRFTTPVDELQQSVKKRLDSYSRRESELENQLRDLQIQVQLSQRQRRNTEAIIYSIRDAVIVIDEFDKLLMANEAAGKLFNFDFKHSQHKSIHELMDESKTEFVDFLSKGRRKKGRATRREIELLQHGEPRILDCIVSCVYDERQQVCGVAAVLHDITREKEVSQMKNDFVSHVSHELKTPLASITAYSEMLADGEADDEKTRKEFCSIIQGQAQRLNRLIEDILNVARIESGLVKVEKKPVSLTILIEELCQMIKGYAEEKNIDIIGRKPIVFDQVYADRDMISQVIVNLLSNAIKYTPSGGSVKIETEVDQITAMARVSVTDTGVGISEDEIQHVFDKFYRVEANKGRAKGTGLGLNLVKQIVEKVHNGRVFVRSRPGAGSTFGFELPLAAAQKVEAV